MAIDIPKFVYKVNYNENVYFAVDDVAYIYATSV